MVKEAKDPAGTASRRRRGRRVRIVFWLVLTAVILVLGGRRLLSEELEVSFYHLYSPKIVGAESVRAVVLSDLHNREFGPGNRELTRQITALEPDLILIAGDMVNADDENLDIVLNLCRALVEIAPVYYSPGNHESNLMYEQDSPLESLLTECGVHFLVTWSEETVVGKTPFLIGGLNTSPEGFSEYGAAFMEEYQQSAAFKLLISHYPSLYYNALADAEIDLAVCGHFHGGQVRLPVLGGLYHVDTGFFPQYSGGMYQLSRAAVFVSRGMGGHSPFPRVNNRPELAVIDINGRQDATPRQS